MALTVKQLITQLKKMPQSATVGFKDHDSSPHEISSYVNRVSILVKEDEPLPEYLKNDWAEVKRYGDMEDITVVLCG